MEEFHEADVLWPEERSNRNSHHKLHISCSRSIPKQNHQKQKFAASSAPIGIPSSKASGGPFSFRLITSYDGGSALATDSHDELEAEETDLSLMVPPHLLLAAQGAGRGCHQKMAFSLCTGQGRTLKGRDLSEVRNTVLRLTGFLEAEA